MGEGKNDLDSPTESDASILGEHDEPAEPVLDAIVAALDVLDEQLPKLRYRVSGGFYSMKDMYERSLNAIRHEVGIHRSWNKLEN